MKYTATLLSAAVLMACSCNEINIDERYRELPAPEIKTCVLVEDFTGQNCVNCPEAHKVLEQLVEQYGEAVIPVSIHAGNFAIPIDYKRYQGLMQPEAQAYNDLFSIQEYPKGIINHTGAPLNYSEWPAVVRTALERDAKASIDLKASVNADSTAITISAGILPYVDGAAKFQLWVLEDGIVARQKDMSGATINDYVHNHVYRCSPNGVGGQPVTLEANIGQSVECQQEVRRLSNETWKLNEISIVAFLYNDNGVIQATKTKLIK